MNYVLIDFILVFIFSVFFGAFLKIEDLIVDDKLKLFRLININFIVPFITTGFALLMLMFSSFHASLIWLGIALSWILRGKIDHYYHGISVGSMLIYLLFFKEIDYYLYSFNLIYLVLLFAIIGFIHDRVKVDYRLKNKIKIKLIDRIFLNYIGFLWLLILLFYQFYFYFDCTIFVTVIGFLLGYTFFYTEISKKILNFIKQKT